MYDDCEDIAVSRGGPLIRVIVLKNASIEAIGCARRATGDWDDRLFWLVLLGQKKAPSRSPGRVMLDAWIVVEEQCVKENEHCREHENAEESEVIAGHGSPHWRKEGRLSVPPQGSTRPSDLPRISEPRHCRPVASSLPAALSCVPGAWPEALPRFPCHQSPARTVCQRQASAGRARCR